MRVFVTGATGFVGRNVLRELHTASHSSLVLARKSATTAQLETFQRIGAEVRRGDILDSASLAPAMAGADAVIHLVGIISEIGENTFESVHTRGTQNVLQAMRQSGISRLVHMSALGTRPGAVSRYHQTKWAAEEAVRASGIRYTIFRPSLIFGPEDQFVNVFARMIRLSPVVPVMGNPTSRFQPVAVEAVAAAFVRALTASNSLGREFDLCGPEAMTLSEIVGTIAQVLGRKRLKLRVPNPVATLQAALLEKLYPTLLRKAAPLNRDQLEMLQEDNVGDASPANALFNLPSIRFRDGIEKYLAAPRKS